MQLFGSEFDSASYLKVPQYIFVGSEDDNTFALPYGTYSERHCKSLDSWLKRLTKYNPAALLQESEELFSGAGA